MTAPDMNDAQIPAPDENIVPLLAIGWIINRISTLPVLTRPHTIYPYTE
jgi:hypothetical protein